MHTVSYVYTCECVRVCSSRCWRCGLVKKKKKFFFSSGGGGETQVFFLRYFFFFFFFFGSYSTCWAFLTIGKRS